MFWVSSSLHGSHDSFARLSIPARQITCHVSDHFLPLNFDAFLAGFGLNLPDWAASTADEGRDGIINIAAIAVCVLVTWIPSRGTKAFGRFELVAVAIKVVLILFIIGLGIFYIDTGNYNPFMPSGFGPVMAGAATVFFAVFGYDAMSTRGLDCDDGIRPSARCDPGLD